MAFFGFGVSKVDLLLEVADEAPCGDRGDDEWEDGGPDKFDGEKGENGGEQREKSNGHGEELPAWLELESEDGNENDFGEKKEFPVARKPWEVVMLLRFGAGEEAEAFAEKALGFLACAGVELVEEEGVGLQLREGVVVEGNQPLSREAARESFCWIGEDAAEFI